MRSYEVTLLPFTPLMKPRAKRFSNRRRREKEIARGGRNRPTLRVGQNVIDTDWSTCLPSACQVDCLSSYRS